MSRRSAGRILKRVAKDGTVSFRLGWELPEDPETGKRQYVYKTLGPSDGVRTKKEAAAALAEILKSLHQGTYVAPAQVTVAQVCEEWLQSRIDLRMVRANTLDGYAIHLRRYVIPRIGSIELQKLTTERVQALYGDLLRAGSTQRKNGSTPKPLSASMVIHVHRTLRQVILGAMKQKRLAFDPTKNVELPKIADDHREGTEGDEGGAVINALDEKQLGALLAGFRDHPLEPLVRLAARTGMRRGELLAVRWRDIDFAKNLLHVEWTVVDGGGKLTIARPKTKRSRRAIALGAGTLAELDAYWKRQAEDTLKLGRRMERSSDDLVFPHSVIKPRQTRHPDAITKVFMTKARKLGFAGLRFHDLRHTHATLLLKSGENLKVVSERLGHSSATITLNVYQHVLPGMQAQAAAKIDSIIDGGVNS